MTARPSDIVSSLLWYRDSEPNGSRFSVGGYENPDRHAESCRVYWGSHGCHRPHGHDGDHWCDCCECENHPDDNSGCVAGPPYYGPDTAFYGDDVREAS